MAFDLRPALADIVAADSLDEIWVLLVRHYRERGFGAVGYLMLDKSSGLDVVALIETGFSRAVVDTFAALGYGSHAPVLRVAMGTAQPHLASQVLDRHPVTPEERMHREAIIAAGLGEALALPLYGPGTRNAVVILAEPADPDLFQTLDWSELQIVAQAAHSRAIAVTPAGPSQPLSLSRRELEILRWVAQGKSNIAIADILAISPDTVDTYLRRLFEKLGVADRTMAAVKGVSMSLITA